MCDMRNVPETRGYRRIEDIVRMCIKQCPNCMRALPMEAVMSDECCGCGVRLYTCYVCFRMPDSAPAPDPPEDTPGA